MSSAPRANFLGSCLQWQLGGARAQWLWSYEADVDVDADAGFDGDDKSDNDDGADRQLLPGIWRQILEDVSLDPPSTLPLLFLVSVHGFLHAVLPNASMGMHCCLTFQ